MTKLSAELFLLCYRWYIRLQSSAFAVLAAGAFAGFGRRSRMILPLRLRCEDRIAIGDDVFVGPNCWLQALPDENSPAIIISIGNGTSMAGMNTISAVRRVQLAESVLIARNVYISDHIHRYDMRNVPVLAQGVEKIQPVLIKRGAWLGQNVVVCPGVTIGVGAVIGANSVVNTDIPDHAVAVGSPARIVKMF